MKEVEILKNLKSEYKAATGVDYDANKKPATSSSAPAAPSASGDSRTLFLRLLRDTTLAT